MRREAVCHLEECPRYHQPMRMVSELTSAWEFECRTCLNRRIVSKMIPGFEGTWGAGRSDSTDARRTNRVGYTKA